MDGSPTTPRPAATADPLSPVEKTKAESDYLRGSIAEELLNGRDDFEKDAVQLLIDGSDNIVQGAAALLARSARISPYDDQPPLMELRPCWPTCTPSIRRGWRPDTVWSCAPRSPI